MGDFRGRKFKCQTNVERHDLIWEWRLNPLFIAQPRARLFASQAGAYGWALNDFAVEQHQIEQRKPNVECQMSNTECQSCCCSHRTSAFVIRYSIFLAVARVCELRSNRLAYSVSLQHKAVVVRSREIVYNPAVGLKRQQPAPGAYGWALNEQRNLTFDQP